MNTPRPYSLILAAATVIAIFHAGAFAVEPVSDDRRVTTFSDEGSNEFLPSAPFAAFSVTGQNSTVTAAQFAGSGSGYGESDFFFFIRESFFDVTFDVVTPALIDLSGDLGAAPGDFGFAEVTVRLISEPEGAASTIYSTSLSADFEPVFEPFAFQGPLAPGRYRLVLETNITPGGFDTFGDYSFIAGFTDDPSGDSDADGVADDADNCTLAANPGQQDGDADGFGNACDADLNNDCIVNTLDLGELRLRFFTADPAADFNSDGVVSVQDLGLMKAAFFGLPGPSALAVCPAAAE